jgi:CxxC-x17-CxxC domain-containing protein
MPDSQIRCSDCGELFLFSEQEQAFFAEKGLNTPPKRCKPCRQARKTASPGGDRGGDRGSDRRPFRSNDAGARPSGGGFGAPRGAPPRGAPRGEPRSEGGWRPREGGAARPANGFAQGGAPSGPPRVSAWKTPHASPTGAPRARDTRERSFGGANQASHAPTPPREEPKPAARERAAKPKFDITCAECGAPSQVPFKPLEGRQVYCQPCYRLRKIASPETLERRDLDAHGADSGIVE